MKNRTCNIFQRVTNAGKHFNELIFVVVFFIFYCRRTNFKMHFYKLLALILLQSGLYLVVSNLNRYLKTPNSNPIMGNKEFFPYPDDVGFHTLVTCKLKKLATEIPPFRNFFQ